MFFPDLAHQAELEKHQGHIEVNPTQRGST